jgi:hypothetical protein
LAGKYFFSAEEVGCVLHEVYAGQPAPGNQYHEPQIKINGQTLQAVENFTYLGSTLSRNANIDAQIDSRISRASSLFGRLRDNVWERRGIRLKTKLNVYHPTLRL